RRGQLFIAKIDGDELEDIVWLTQGIDGNIPSKPWGGPADYSFSPDGQTVYFDVKAQTPRDAWSTNFDIYAVPADGSRPPRNLTAANKAWDSTPLPSPDGKTLYYRAMSVPGFEADRFAIMAMDLATGKVQSGRPRSPRSEDHKSELQSRFDFVCRLLLLKINILTY